MDATIEASIADIEAYNQQNLQLMDTRLPMVQAQEESSHCDEDDEFDDSIMRKRSSVCEESEKISSEDITSSPQILDTAVTEPE